MKLSGQVFRYLMSGSTAAFIQFTLIYVLTEFAGLWYIFSLIFAFVAAVIASFTLQKFWTFKDKSMDALYGQMALYLMLTLTNLAFNVFGVYLLVERIGFWYMYAQFLVVSVIAIESFVIYRLYIFKVAVSRAAE